MCSVLMPLLLVKLSGPLVMLLVILLLLLLVKLLLLLVMLLSLLLVIRLLLVVNKMMLVVLIGSCRQLPWRPQLFCFCCSQSESPRLPTLERAHIRKMQPVLTLIGSSNQPLLPWRPLRFLLRSTSMPELSSTGPASETPRGRPGRAKAEPTQISSAELLAEPLLKLGPTCRRHPRKTSLMPDAVWASGDEKVLRFQQPAPCHAEVLIGAVRASRTSLQRTPCRGECTDVAGHTEATRREEQPHRPPQPGARRLRQSSQEHHLAPSSVRAYRKAPAPPLHAAARETPGDLPPRQPPRRPEVGAWGSLAMADPLLDLLPTSRSRADGWSCAAAVGRRRTAGRGRR
mmetsp:Transcript_89752/g.161906  ORF Transcript_89752/g.161906 Transcript_89752/m.161906 type:complete len:344 (+) Transcript_89752:36-1067(+)